jgi:hypothetical protein
MSLRRSRRRGVAYVFLMVTLLPLMATIGLMADLGAAQLTETRLSAGLDSAARAARVMQVNTGLDCAAARLRIAELAAHHQALHAGARPFGAELHAPRVVCEGGTPMIDTGARIPRTLSTVLD